MKKIIAFLGSFVCLLSLFAFSACSLFDTDETTHDLSQYYSDDCPINMGEKTVILYDSDLQLIFVNSSDKKIIAYEAIVVLYDVYGEALKYAWNDSVYNKLTESPSGFSPQKEDIQFMSITDKVYTAEIYIYYVLFEDQTSWGYRNDLTIDDVQKYGTCTKVVKK